MFSQISSKIFLYVILLSIATTTNVFSQFSFKSEIMNQIKIMKSPEADAFEKYGNTPVSLYTGTPNISIPLHTLKGREFEVPISLSYDASGIKVSQVATNVGLGWNLNVGGRISRIANGRPDDVNVSSGPFSEDSDTDLQTIGTYQWFSLQDFEDHHELRKKLSYGCKDLLFDVYSLNVMGINDYIYIDRESMQAYTLVNPNIKVEGGYDPSFWKVTAEDGTQYFFGENNNHETATLRGIDDGGSLTDATNPCASSPFNTNTSWVLTRIVSKNGLDEFTFDYESYSWANPIPGQTISSITNIWGPAQGNTSYSWGPNGPNYSYSSELNTTQQMVKKIKLNGVLLADFTFKSRVDINFNAPNNGGALDYIKFYKFNYDENDPRFHIEPVFKRITFNHTYFGSDSWPTYIYKRLKLDNFVISEGLNSTSNNSKTYSFEYFAPDLVPAINSNAQDYLGLYNGANSNSSLVPRLDTSYGGLLSGAIRDFNLTSATAGTLKKIYYPTKGYTEFEFQQHDVTPYYPSPVNNDVQYALEEGGMCLPTGPPRNAVVHPSMLNATGASAEVFTAPYPGTYKIRCEGNGAFLIHRPRCSDFTDATSSLENRNASHSNSDYNSITSGCRGEYIPIPTNEVYSMMSLGPLNNNSGSVYTSNTAPQNQTVDLHAGTYQLTVWRYENTGCGGIGPGNGSGMPTQGTSVKIYRTVTSYPPNREPQGFRIWKIKDYSNENTLETEKEYRYLRDFNSPISSGKEISFIPAGESHQVRDNDDVNSPVRTHLTRTSAGIENNPHVVYSDVFELEKSGSTYNGYIHHQFSQAYTPNGLVSQNGVKNYIQKHDDGKETMTKIYSANNTLISEEHNVFETPNEYSTGLTGSFEGGISAVVDIENTGNLTHWYMQGGQVNQDYAVRPYVQPEFGGNPEFIGGCAAPCFEIYAQNIPCISNVTRSNYDYNCKKGDYAHTLTPSSFNFGPNNLISKTKITYTDQFVNSTTVRRSVSETEKYKYNYDNLLAEKNKASINNGFAANPNSDNLVNGIKTIYTYDDGNYPGNPEKITDINVYKVDAGVPTLLSHRNNTFTDYGYRNGAMQANFLTEIKEAKGNNPLETRLRFDYNSAIPNQGDGNIKESIQVTGTNTNIYESYIFGYNDQYPVAKITGMPYSGVDTNLIGEIKFWSNQPIIDQNPITDPSTVELRIKLTTLRGLYPDAQITTYTYNPTKGMTSETNPKGITTYYEYDELGRLKRVKDKDQNILSENEYHYRTQN